MKFFNTKSVKFADMKMNMNNWIAGVKQSSKRLAIPIMTHPGIDLAGETVFKAVTDGSVHFMAIEELNKKYPPDAVTIIMDLTVEAEAFGSEVNFCQHDVPSITGRLVDGPVQISKLSVPACGKGRTAQYLLAARLASENIKGKPVFAGCIGPLSLAGRLFDMTALMTEMYLDPASIHILLQKCTEFISQYINEFKSAGTNGIIIAEPAAGLVPAELCNEFSSSYVRKIVEQLQDDDFLVILHNCGNIGHLTQSMVDTGAGALHFGNKLNIGDALAHVPRKVLVMGNLDPVGVFKMSLPAAVYDTTMTLLNQTSGFDNFILSSGCDVPPGVNPENIAAFYQALADYNSEKR